MPRGSFTRGDSLSVAIKEEAPAIAGVLTPLAVVLLLTLLPYFDWHNEGVAVWFNRQGRIAQAILSAIVIAVVALTIMAALR